MTKLYSNLINLKYFLDVVKTGSFGESAKHNHVSQSAISQAIAKLEEALEYPLFSHQPGRCKVTEKGMQLFEGAQEIFQTLQRVENAITEQDGGVITFACTHSFAIELLPDYLKQASIAFPSLKINFRLGHYHSIKEWLKKGMIDFGILLDNDDLSLFDCKKLFQGHFLLYAAKKCNDPSGLGFLLDSDERRESNFLKKHYMDRYKKELPVCMEISSWEVIANLTEAGLGIGLFPDYVAKKREKQLKVVFSDLKPTPYTVYAVFKKNKLQNPQVLKFCELLIQGCPNKSAK
jgi:DNA-binding transcriptional LysR family regulator